MTQDRYDGYKRFDALLDKAGIKAEDELAVSIDPDYSTDFVRLGFQKAGADPKSVIRYTDASLETLSELHEITESMIRSLPAKRL